MTGREKVAEKVTRNSARSNAFGATAGLVLAMAYGVTLATPWACSNTHTSREVPSDDGAGGSAGGAGGSGAGPGMGEGGTGDTSGECDPGAKSCDELTPMACTEDGAWAPARAPCAIACSLGECAECADDSVTCRDGAVQVCTDGAWLVQEECENVCEAGECTDTCSEGWLQCSDNVLQRCEDADYVTLEVCEFLCADEQDGAAACTGECLPDERRCNADGEAETCGGDGEWDIASATACDAGTFCVNGDCKSCEPGSLRCSGSLPQECSSDGEWVNQGACTDEALSHCLDGECVTCAPGALRCLSNELEECLTDGSGWQLLESCAGETPACLADQGICGNCDVSSTQCDGNNVQACEDGVWVPLTACTGATPACQDGQCAECLDDATRACGECGQGIQTCTSGTWGNCVEADGACVPVPPANWEGPVVVHDSELGGGAPDCEGDFAVASGDFYGDLDAPAAECDCECSAPVSGSARCRPHFEMHTDLDCEGNSFATLDPLVNAGCSSYWSGPIMGSVDVTALNVDVTSSAECTSSLDQSLPSVAWGTTLTSCAPTTAPSECATGMLCADSPPDEFNRGYCIYRTGDRSCPAPYSGTRLLLYQAVEDTRACSSCSCGTPAGFTCNWSFVVSADDVCSETPMTSTGCVNLGLGDDTMWWRNTSSVSGGSCAPSGGAAQGSASPAEPVTVCCID